METIVDTSVCALIIGSGATAVMDVWTIVRRRLLGIPLPDYGLVGRWLAHMTRGQFRHDSIAKASRALGERFLGWTAHYLIGVAFAAVLLYLWGVGWIRHPTIWPAMIVGLGSVAAPFFLMQPGMGAGVAASRTPYPAAARLQSCITHTIFGIGLYAGGWVAHYVYRL